MLRIRKLKHLASAIGISTDRLREVVDNPEPFCQHFTLINPAKPGKERPVLSVSGDLRKAQNGLLRAILARKLLPSPVSHGSVRERNVLTNIKPHQESLYALKADISNFFPSISHNRVYRLFVHEFECSPDVANVCTKLCTHDYHLALGLTTSPIIADQILMQFDRRLLAACNKTGLKYSRFVDDIAISGPFNLELSGFESLIANILSEHGFQVNPAKVKYGRFCDGLDIAKITIRNGHPDVMKEYLRELERQIEDHRSLGEGEAFLGPYFTRDQILGRVRYVCWINPRRRKKLFSLFQMIPWRKVQEQANGRGLVQARKQLIRSDR